MVHTTHDGMGQLRILNTDRYYNDAPPDNISHVSTTRSNRKCNFKWILQIHYNYTLTRLAYK
jgi:hypothetical protein